MLHLYMWYEHITKLCTLTECIHVVSFCFVFHNLHQLTSQSAFYVQKLLLLDLHPVTWWLCHDIFVLRCKKDNCKFSNSSQKHALPWLQGGLYLKQALICNLSSNNVILPCLNGLLLMLLSVHADLTIFLINSANCTFPQH